MSRPAPWAAAVMAQAGVETRLAARRGENLLAMVGIPVAVLLFLGPVLARGALDGLLPGTLALAIVASGLVNLGIATAYERGYGVLKRLGGSPLGRPGMVAAKLVVVIAIALAQVGGLIAVAALVLGWRAGPEASVPAIAVTSVVGAATFAGLGLTVASILRPEAALVVANVLFLLALGIGGALVPIGDLPAPLAAFVRVLPTGALSEAFAAALGSGGSLGPPLAILGAWAVGSLLVAARAFRWD
jgi:ABC-2 type transport system permease protein